jgi:predicted PurR-regulated permease PerM
VETQRGRRGLIASEPVLLLATVIAVLYFGRPILIPVALAITLNFLLAPAVTHLQRFRIRRVPAVIIVVVVAGSLVGGVGWIVVKQLLRIADELPDYRQNLHLKMEALNAPSVSPFGKMIRGVREVGQEFYSNPAPAPSPAAPSAPPNRESRRKLSAASPPAAQPSAPFPVTVVQPERGIPDLLNALAPVVRPLGEGVFVLVLTIYMLIKREDLRNRMLLLAGMGRINLVTQALDDAARRISSFLTMNFLVNAGYGLLFGVGLRAIGIPNATLWGVLAGTLRFVPYIGTSIGVLLPFVFTLGIFPQWGPALVVLALFAMLEFPISNFFEPWLYGSHTGISTLSLLVMAVFWTLLWGWPGLVLSTPLTVCLIVTGLHLPEMSFLHILLGENAQLSPEAKFYERLLAMDQPEAHRIADSYLENHSLAAFYDALMLPALSLAERDRHKGALDEIRANFVFQCANELIAELSDFALVKEGDIGTATPVNQSRTFPVICVSTQDQADEVVATMLAQILEQAGNRTLQLPSRALSDEILTRLAEETDTVICISALPPFAFADTRALGQRIRAKLPKNRIIVGFWDPTVETDRVRERLGSCRPDQVVTNLAEASAQIREWQNTNLFAGLVLRDS